MPLSPIRHLARALTVAMVGASLLMLTGVADQPALRQVSEITNDQRLSEQWYLGELAPAGIHSADAWDDNWHYLASDGEMAYVYPYDADTGAAIGPLLVRYGEYGSGWTYGTQQGNFKCDPQSFNNEDPAPYVVKRCEVAPYWIKAVNEGQQVQVTPGVPTWVRYGHDQRWAYAQVSEPVRCGMNLLQGAYQGDPAYLQEKMCQIQSRPWGGIIATEGQKFTIPKAVPGASQPTDKGALVRYGVPGGWMYNSFAAGSKGVCTPAYFDNHDPAIGKVKRCEVVTTMGAGATIAAIDVGDVPHPDMEGKLVGGANIIDGTLTWSDTCNPAQAGYGHGLGVGGIAAAASNNYIGIAGVSPYAKLLQVKNTINCDVDVTSTNFSSAILYAAGLSTKPVNKNPADVIMITTTVSNYECPVGVRSALAAARQAGVVVVAAVANHGTSMSDALWNRDFPLNCGKDVAIVIPTDRAGNKLANADYGSSVMLSAPGQDILSLSLDADGKPSYALGSGPSRAVPIVAGVIATMRAAFPNLTLANILNRIQLSSRSQPAGCNGCGIGMVAYDRAMRSGEVRTRETESNDNYAMPNYVAAPADILGDLSPRDAWTPQHCTTDDPCCTDELSSGPTCTAPALKVADQDWYLMHLPPGQQIDVWIQNQDVCPLQCYFDIRPFGSPAKQYSFGEQGHYTNTGNTYQAVYIQIHSATPVKTIRDYQLNMMWRPKYRAEAPQLPGRLELR